MYQAGQLVIYGIHGVCRIIQEEQRIVDRKKVTYLVLEPLGTDGSRYMVPTHNPVAIGKLRPMLSREELEALMESDLVRQDSWLQEENQRKQTYRELIGSGDRERLVQMVCSLYRRKKRMAEEGKKFHLCDENFLRDAERLLISEFSVVLGIQPDQARQYIRSKLSPSDCGSKNP